MLEKLGKRAGYVVPGFSHWSLMDSEMESLKRPLTFYN